MITAASGERPAGEPEQALFSLSSSALRLLQGTLNAIRSINLKRNLTKVFENPLH